jgi:hypothetical protein
VIDGNRPVPELKGLDWSLQQLSRRSGVADGGGGVESEYGGEMQRVGAMCQGFFELAVDAEPFDGGVQAAAWYPAHVVLTGLFAVRCAC